MEKILLAIDATSLSMPALDFACYLSRLTHSELTGVFLENRVADEKPVLKSIQGVDYPDGEAGRQSEEYQQKRTLIEKNIVLFNDACGRRSIRHSILRESGVPASDLIYESRFADLIVTDAATSFRKTFEGVPTEFVKDVLKEAECPVIVAPESFEGIDEIVFACNGTRSSIFAMKQFTYLFPQLSEKKAVVLHISESGAWSEDARESQKKWLQNHYSSIGFETLAGDTEDRLFDYLFKRKNTFIVMGAYGRSSFSLFFKHSHADLIIRTVTQPLFISHY